MPGWGGGAEVGAEKASRVGGEIRCGRKPRQEAKEGTGEAGRCGK